MKTLRKILFILLLLPFSVACVHIDDDCTYDKYQVNIATVVNPNKSTNFTFQLDNNKLMKVTSSAFNNYIPTDGQRIIANYSILSMAADSTCNVRLNDVYTVLTKSIFPITPAKQDSIGNDSIYVDNMWIGGDCLNVEFSYQGNDKIHLINLVSDASKVYTDGKTHLEFRHNANNDRPVYYRQGIVSFKLSPNLHIPLSSVIAAPITLVIHVNVANQAAEKLYELKYTYGKLTLAPKQAKMIYTKSE